MKAATAEAFQDQLISPVTGPALLSLAVVGCDKCELTAALPCMAVHVHVHGVHMCMLL
jgi:hypothetical protein